MGFDFEIIVPETDEKIVPGEMPADHVIRVSREKAGAVAADFPGDIVLGADTAVVLNGEIFGKPKSASEAMTILGRLSGNTHTVYTGLTMINSSAGATISRYDSADVFFNHLSESEIEQYVRTGEPLDKAGAYGIQGMGSFLVKSYEGNLDTIIGFPRKLFREMYADITS